MTTKGTRLDAINLREKLNEYGVSDNHILEHLVVHYFDSYEIYEALVDTCNEHGLEELYAEEEDEYDDEEEDEDEEEDDSNNCSDCGRDFRDCTCEHNQE